MVRTCPPGKLQGTIQKVASINISMIAKIDPAVLNAVFQISMVRNHVVDRIGPIARLCTVFYDDSKWHIIIGMFPFYTMTV